MLSTQLFSAAQLRRSFLVAASITAPLCLFGYWASMGLAHSGGLFLLLYAPTFPIFALFGGHGPYSGIPEWAFYALTVGAELSGVFVLVHVIRIVTLRASSGGA